MKKISNFFKEYKWIITIIVLTGLLLQLCLYLAIRNSNARKACIDKGYPSLVIVKNEFFCQGLYKGTSIIVPLEHAHNINNIE